MTFNEILDNLTKNNDLIIRREYWDESIYIHLELNAVKIHARDEWIKRNNGNALFCIENLLRDDWCILKEVPNSDTIVIDGKKFSITR